MAGRAHRSGGRHRGGGARHPGGSNSVVAGGRHAADARPAHGHARAGPEGHRPRRGQRLRGGPPSQTRVAGSGFPEFRLRTLAPPGGLHLVVFDLTHRPGDRRDLVRPAMGQWGSGQRDRLERTLASGDHNRRDKHRRALHRGGTQFEALH